MLSEDFTDSKTLEEFYKNIRKFHESKYTSNYTLVHDALRNLIDEKTTFKEFGVNQGATAAATLLKKPKNHTICDLNLNNWKPYKSLFIDFAKANDINFKYMENRSTNPETISICDVLYIDTTHKASVLKKELELHHKYVTKYIVCHDTFSRNMLQSEIIKFCNKTSWKILEYNQKSVGYTILGNF